MDEASYIVHSVLNKACGLITVVASIALVRQLDSGSLLYRVLPVHATHIAAICTLFYHDVRRLVKIQTTFGRGIRGQGGIISIGRSPVEIGGAAHCLQGGTAVRSGL